MASLSPRGFSLIRVHGDVHKCRVKRLAAIGLVCTFMLTGPRSLKIRCSVGHVPLLVEVNVERSEMPRTINLCRFQRSHVTPNDPVDDTALAACHKPMTVTVTTTNNQIAEFFFFLSLLWILLGSEPRVH